MVHGGIYPLAAVHCQNQQLFAEIMPMLCLSYSWPYPYCHFVKFPQLLLHLHTLPILSLLHFSCFLLMQAQAAMIRSTAATPTRSVQPAPETATPFASAGCPLVRLARSTLQNQLLATIILAYFHRCVPTACPNA